MTNDALLNALSQLVSEGRNPETMDIDLLSSQQILARMNQQDALVPLAVEKVIPDIALAVDAITKAFKQGGRLLYFGCRYQWPARCARRIRMPTNLWHRP